MSNTQSDGKSKAFDVSMDTTADSDEPSQRKRFFRNPFSKNKEKEPLKVVSLPSLFRYATFLDKLLMFIGVITGLIHGITLPLIVLIFGNLIKIFTDRTRELCTLNYTSLSIDICPPGYQLTSSNYFSSFSTCNFTLTNITTLDFKGLVSLQVNYIAVTGCLCIVFGYLQVAFCVMSAERQTRTIRQTLFRSILRKDISYFDKHKSGDLTTKLTDDVNKVRDGIGDKVSITVQYISSFVGGMIIGFIKGWKLTLVISSLSPLMFFGAHLFTKLSLSLTTMELKAYGKAGAVAEEVFSSIRTVLSYNGQRREQARYEKHLSEARKSGIKKGAVVGMTMGALWFVVYCEYALGFWYGGKLIRDGENSIGDLLTVFFCLSFGIFNLGLVGPHFQAFTSARAAARIVWDIIDEPSKIDSHSEAGLKNEDIIGDIHFKDVHFTYPSRPGVKILNGISFDVKRGQTIALVGSSGSGKSTCVQLLQRFYDADQGSIFIDEHQVTAYNLSWLRDHIGVVSQEPILFQTTIRENILFGRQSATDAEVHEAAKMANAHDFIMTLPDKYETQVGEQGAALSGGQKQRIAIARALVRDPKILLLDEATSALDNESEKIVQEALDRAAEGRTTLVIAHRLSTIRNADKIVVMDKGEVVEEGDHETLMNAGGVYYGLVEQQNLRLAEEEERIAFERQESVGLVQAQHNEQEKRKSLRKQSSAFVSVSLKSSMIEEEEHEEIEQDVEEKQNKEKKQNVALQMAMMNKPEWILIFFACISCLISGGTQPAFGVILSKLSVVFQECDSETQERKVLLYTILFLGMAVICWIVLLLQNFLFACSGEALTKRLRSKTFIALLRQEVSYFDDPNHNTGALCARLATEASAVQGITGIRIGNMLQIFGALGVGIIISFVFSWQLTLLMLAFVPFMVAGGFLENHLVTGQSSGNNAAFIDAGKIAVESIQNIRTVVQLTKEDYFHRKYSQFIQIPYRSSIKRANIFGLSYAFSISVIYFSLAALFRLGAHLVSQGDMTLENVLLCFYCLLFGSQNVGQTVSMAPDYKKAMAAAENILELLNRKPPIDNGSTVGDQISDFSGKLEFTNVDFIYPSRPESTILTNFKLKVNAGQSVALVGASGCGKSTTVQLIERFYDANVGQLLVDSKDVRSLDLQWYRSQIGIVSQEPVLFDMSIRDNIAYGDNSRDDISLDQIIQAAKSANIHDFIQTLPQGYDTNCGAKGTQLSGGQKQRIAIARALIRDPKILLLDEATSALDSESEKMVQDALDRAQENRTSITIAHRLSTIQNADMIYVLHNGVIVESGTHQELVALRGRYYRLALGKPV